MDRRAPARTRRSLKRKLEVDFEEENRKSRRACAQPEEEEEEDLPSSVRAHVEVLASTFSCPEPDRSSANHASRFLSQLAKDEETVDLIVDCGAIPPLVNHLRAPPVEADGLIPYEHEVEKWSALALGLLAIKPEHQRSIVDAGALPHLVHLLKRHNKTARAENRGVNGVVRRAADAITNLAHENSSIKTLVRIEGGIPPLLELLASVDVKIQRSAAAALRTLAFKNDENKNQIVECNALPTLVLMLRSEETSVQHEAVGVIGNLVHSSPDIKKVVLQAGVLQPIIRLLSSPCSESQRESALLLGQFAAGDTDCKVQIAQRGAIRPLIDMLSSQDSQLSEMAAFALGRLAQETNSQAGIVYAGGMVPLLKLLESKNEFLQHNAAFALYGLVDNEDNVADFIKVGGFQKLLEGVFRAQPTKDCVGRTLKRLEERTTGGVLNYLLYLMCVSEKAVQRTIALSLAHLCSPDDRKTIFLDNNGLELLLDLFESGSLKQHRDSSTALFNLATKVKLVSPVVAAPPSPTPQVYLDEKYVNNPTLSDVTFLVEGKRFYAHRICLLASSDAFRAMFDGGYKERDAKDVEIPNIRWQVFESMMRYIYTGSVDVIMDVAQELLIAADQYLLEGLKRLCEYAIAKDMSKDNISLMYELAEGFNAVSLKEACILFLLEKSAELSAKPWYPEFVQRILPEIRSYFTKACSKPTEE